MVVVIPVICALTLHELFYLRERAFTLLELSMEHLQLTPRPRHPVAASVDRDLPGGAKGEPSLAEAKWLREWDDLAFALIHPDAQGFKTPHHLPDHSL